MPGNHAQVGLIRLFGGRSSAARTTFSLNAWSYVVRFFLVREPAGDEVGVGINKGTFGPKTQVSWQMTHEVRPYQLETPEKECETTPFNWCIPPRERAAPSATSEHERA